MYVPVLKNRQEEIKALCFSSLSNKTLPLLEIVQAKSRSNLKKTLLQELQGTLGNNTTVMIDILNLKSHKKSKEAINEFFLQINKNPNYRLNLYDSLKPLKNFIPIISYDPNNYDKLQNEIQHDVHYLRNNFRKLGFRLKVKHFNDALSEIKSVIQNEDIIILDIEHKKHTDSSITDFSNKINNLKTSKNLTTFIINSVIPEDLTNKNMSDGQPISTIDNSLRDNYLSYGFDGFGYYTTIKSALPPSGGGISPGFIYYSYKSNKFIGFRGRFPNLDEFKNHIIPKLTSSKYWNNYPPIHHSNCSGCNHILNLINTSESAKHQGKWKQISIKHYIYTMDKHLP
ncbi:hypothetical protein FDB15_12915 [Clostridium botulinum]|uniref:beta family protein n=1 Tax=unclassified Clostridium TaxID=2614128 RepID=UPI0013C8F03A|nr:MULTISPECIES: hypothetical protein [unclassified Clostridium]MBY7008657.1 hypothetical protein [Clostridium botulinum]NFH73281.1 hypothetical protein [Clostridium botulinum]NFI01487.1 hypothetical protein [Clostridium botulinum]NFI64621.1 hypothetical protein [Clostridium botulinum]NFI81619.1 hypothetical protein [Clostridium botulinum]